MEKFCRRQTSVCFVCANTFLKRRRGENVHSWKQNLLQRRWLRNVRRWAHQLEKSETSVKRKQRQRHAHTKCSIWMHFFAIPKEGDKQKWAGWFRLSWLATRRKKEQKRSLTVDEWARQRNSWAPDPPGRVRHPARNTRFQPDSCQQWSCVSQSLTTQKHLSTVEGRTTLCGEVLSVLWGHHHLVWNRTKVPSTQDAERHVQCDASKWELLMWMGVSTLHASNIKGKTFEFTCASRPASCVDWTSVSPLKIRVNSNRLTGLDETPWSVRYHWTEWVPLENTALRWHKRSTDLCSVVRDGWDSSWVYSLRAKCTPNWPRADLGSHSHTTHSAKALSEFVWCHPGDAEQICLLQNDLYM